MRVQFYGQLIVFGMSSILVSGCSFKKTSAVTDPAHPSPGISQGPQSGNAAAAVTDGAPAPVAWDDTTLSVPGVVLRVKSMPADLQIQNKKSFRVPDLEEIHSDFSGSYTLYRMKNAPAQIENPQSIVFIQPKVFVYGTAQGGNVVQLTSRDNKTASLTFAMAFVDGTRASLPSHEGTHAVVLPDSLTIPSLEKLKTDLRAQIGIEPRLMGLTTCPRQMELRYLRGGSTERLPLLPTVSIRNRCPMDEFFTVTVRSTREEINDLVQNGIVDGLGVQLQADFQVQYREAVAFYSLELEPMQLYTELRKKFIETPFGQSSDPTIYFAFQLVEPLEAMLRDRVTQTGVTDGWIPYFQGVQILMDTFFDSVKPEEGCQAPNRCFRLKHELSVKMDEPVELQWIENSLLAASQRIPTVTFVKGLSETYPIQVNSTRVLPVAGVVPSQEACDAVKGNIPGCKDFSCEKFSENPYCRFPKHRNPIHAFQVFPGAKIKLSFDRITEWGFELPSPREDTTADQKKGTIKCADTEPIPGACVEYEEYCPVDKVPFCKHQKDDCVEEHTIFQDYCRNERTTERSCGFLGLGHCKEVLKENRTICEHVEAGHECLRWKSSCDGEVEMVCPRTERRCKTPAVTCNQWTTEFYSKYTYSEPWVRPQTLNLDKGQTIEQLWDGLDLEFSWLEEDARTWHSVACPIKAFANRVDGYSITVLLENQDDTSCQPFNTWNTQPGRWPQIAVVNHINFEKPYLCGTLEWTHSIAADPNAKEHVVDRLEYRCSERQE